MADARTHSICFRLRRTTIEDAFVRVPLTDEMFKAFPDEDGKTRLDADKVIQAALVLGHDAGTDWVVGGPAKVEPHPWQVPPPEGR